ncbi:hypothetical protein [Faecalicatena contorta]|uniref:Leucine rich repeat-containing protein n=1 Tax=Faecalicatena contorta TaxID=39482 RepID=A0A315ZU74_9FIRM|nr:hypothetical protein [Faecalicatena contorta]PWJ48264.1 hypothetical protein A8805_11385 [Faecalicatena contorta]SUQ15540.1 hypothetical protein SAMN05216529_11385 [Faecalicatena contorta]
MEYCGKIVGNQSIRKRGLRMAGVLLSLVFIIGTVYELPALNFMEMDSKYRAEFENRPQKAETFPGTGIHTKDIKDILVKEISEVRTSVKSAEESIKQLSKGEADSLPTSFAAENAVADNIVDESIMDIPVDDSKVEVPVIPPISVIPETPTKPETPTVPNPSTTPDKTETPNETETPDNTGGSGGVKEEEEPGENTGGEEPIVQPEGFLINEGGMIYSYNPEAGLTDENGILKLPSEECTGILASAFVGVGAGICELHIPANITYIETGALNQLTELGCIEVSPDNPAYISEDGVLFDSSMTTILAFPVSRVGNHIVPGSVTRLAEYSFAGSGLAILDMRKCGIVEFGENAFEGTTLQIFAPREYREQYEEMLSGSGVVIR